jgi:peptidoglycan hydrolase CwlO-like protein
MKDKELEARLDKVQKKIEEYRRKLDELEKRLTLSFEWFLKRQKPKK